MFDRNKVYRDAVGDTWEYDSFESGWFHTDSEGRRGDYAWEKPVDGPWTVVEETKDNQVYKPGDILTSSHGNTLIIGSDGGAYFLPDRNPHSISVPFDGTKPFIDITHVNGAPVGEPGVKLESAPVGALAVNHYNDGTVRTYVHLPDGWVIASVGSDPGYRGKLQGGATGVRLYATSELPTGTELVES